MIGVAAKVSPSMSTSSRSMTTTSGVGVLVSVVVDRLPSLVTVDVVDSDIIASVAAVAV